MMQPDHPATAAAWPHRTFHEREGIAIAATVMQASQLLCRRLRTNRASLIFVDSGSKTLGSSIEPTTIRAGEAVALAGLHDFDITNKPDADQPYQARSLIIAPELLSADIKGATSITALTRVAQPPAGLREAFERAMAAIEAGDTLPARIAASRVREVLLWLAEAGYAFAQPHPPGFVDRVRDLLGAEPARPWRSEEIASRLGVSEATLRRKLAADGTAFSEVLADIRMSTALFLLQSTDRPVTVIAGDVGYDSPSRFAARFRTRFDFSPSDIRGQRRSIERIGTQIDRLRAAVPAAE